MKWIPIKKKLPDFGKEVILKIIHESFKNDCLVNEEKLEIGHLVNIDKDGYHFKIKHVDGEAFPDEWMETPKSRKKRKCKNEKEKKKRTEGENIEINLETKEDSPELLEKRKKILKINEKVMLRIRTNLEIDYLCPIADYSEELCDNVITEYEKLLQQFKNLKNEPIVVDKNTNNPHTLII